MGVVEIALMGVALSADAMSVTICNLVANPRLPRGRAFLMPLFFGLFQGLMPMLGYFAGSLAGDLVEAYSGVVALVILGAVGGKMIWDGAHPDGGPLEEDAVHPDDGPALAGGHLSGSAADSVSVASIVLQAIATSIDAFAVGITLAAANEPVFVDAGIIALCTLVLCAGMVAVGRQLGERFGSRAQIVGGIVLVAIGLRAFLA